MHLMQAKMALNMDVHIETSRVKEAKEFDSMR